MEGGKHGLPITVQLFQSRTILSLQEFLASLKLNQDQTCADPAIQLAPVLPSGCESSRMEGSPAEKKLDTPQIPGEDFCRFCRKNGERPPVFLSHRTYDSTNQRVVTCPILRRHTCPLCGATGDSAHTLFYCPLNGNKGSRPVMATLRDRRTASGIKPTNWNR